MPGIRIALAAACASLLVAGCSPEGSDQVAEPLDGNTYRSETFGLTVTAPEGWYVADTAYAKELIDAGGDVITSGLDNNQKPAFEAAIDRTSTIFSFFKHAPGAPVEFNPFVMGLAENVAILPGVKNGRDYYFHMLRTLDRSGVEYEQVGDFSVRMIDGRNFDQLDIDVGFGSVAARQTYLSARHGEYVIAIIETYTDDAGHAELEAIVDSIRLDW